MKIKMMIIVPIFILAISQLYGCVAMLLAPVAAGGAILVKTMAGSKPRMVYTVNGKEIELDISTYSANVMSVKNMVEVGAAMIADQMGCHYLASTYAKWPNSILQAAVKVETIVVYECTSKPTSKVSGVAGAIGAIVDVQKKLRYERDLVQIIENNNLLVSRDGSPISRMPQASRRHIENNIRGIFPASHDKNVIFVQKKLFDLGYNPGPVDGKMGKITKKAIIQYQRDRGMNATGLIDSSTLEQMKIE